MDELEIQGKKYISSKRASELTGYAKDYIGQLARSGKIVAIRMGRAWYIEKDALLAHHGTEANAPAIPSAAEMPASRAILSSIQKKPLSISAFRALGYSQKKFPRTWVPVSYFADDTDLIPTPSQRLSSPSPAAILAPKEASKSDLSLESAIRIKILTERLHPVTKPLQKTPEIARKAKEIKRRRRNPSHVLSLGALSAALILFFFFSAGLFLSSSLRISGTGSLYSAATLLGFDYVHDFVSHYPPLAMGISAIVGFLGLVASSFVEFFVLGFQFLTSLIHLL